MLKICTAEEISSPSLMEKKNNGQVMITGSSHSLAKKKSTSYTKRYKKQKISQHTDDTLEASLSLRA
jgi:hypothetical protein